jgi:hypothetical protein
MALPVAKIDRVGAGQRRTGGELVAEELARTCRERRLTSTRTTRSQDQ